MTVATEDSIRALPLNSEEVMFGELNLTRYALEKLFESDEAPLPKEELFNDVLKIVEVSERIKEAETLRQKADIYLTYSIVSQLYEDMSRFSKVLILPLQMLGHNL